MRPHSQNHLEALAKTATHDALFAAIGGEHFTSNNMCDVAELAVRNNNAKQKRIQKRELQALLWQVKQGKFCKMVSLHLCCPRINVLFKRFNGPHPTGKLMTSRGTIWKNVI